jgi:hypothetical protein
LPDQGKDGAAIAEGMGTYQGRGIGRANKQQWQVRDRLDAERADDPDAVVATRQQDHGVPGQTFGSHRSGTSRLHGAGC